MPYETATRKPRTVKSLIHTQKRGIHSILNPSGGTPHPTMSPAAGLQSPTDRRDQLPLLKFVRVVSLL